MNVETARRLNAALNGIDAAKVKLSVACDSASDDATIEAAGDEYEAARMEMGAVMQTVAGEREESGA